MGKMKDLYQFKQEMVMKNHPLKDMPDSYFIELYLEEQEYYASLNEAQLPQDTYDRGEVQEP